MYCTHYIPSVLICICTINKDYNTTKNNKSGKMYFIKCDMKEYISQE